MQPVLDKAIARARKRPMAEDKMSALLTKLRKGDREPLEVSPDATAEHAERVKDFLNSLKGSLLHHQSGKLDVIRDRQGTEYRRGNPSFERTLELAISNLESDINFVSRDLKLYRDVVAAWKPRPMPHEGEFMRDVQFFLK
jgi:hypothetical protein